jgi:limonene-1,2-epoxide hydrolase
MPPTPASTPRPEHGTAGGVRPDASEPAVIVVGFLRALAASDVDTALGFVDDDLVYANVTLPTLYGKDRLERIARPFLRPDRMGFNVHFNHVATEGESVVLTDRIDELNFGRFASRFWVYGRFVVHDAKITVWRDSFDWLDVTIGNLRGLAGLVWPGLNRRMPSD